MSPMETAQHKVLVIGVDGGTLDLIQPMISRGRLPTLAHLMQAGAWGTLSSTVPPVSPVAWSSFMTGQNPAKHHILDFLYTHKQSNGNIVQLPVNGSILEGTTLWQLLGDMGKNVGVINVPVTFPPKPVNGFLISGFPMPINAPNYTYPTALAAELQEHGWNLSDIAIDLALKRELDTYIAGLYRREEERIQATLYLMDRFNSDFMMVHLFETDRIQHAIFNQWAAWNAGQDDPMAKRYGPEMERFFETIDRDIERLRRRLEEVAPNNTIVIMSDHGFGPTLKSAHVYNLLRKAGLMRLKSNAPVALKQLLALEGFTPANMVRLLPHFIRRQLHSEGNITKVEKGSRAGSPVASMAKLLRRLAKGAVLGMDDVDWKRTRAYCLGNSGLVHIYVNLQGRESHGSVPPSDYESTRAQIIEALRAWRDPADGQPVVKQIYRREEIYSGPHLEEAADIIALLRDDSTYVASNGPLFLSNQIIDQHDFRDRANHRMNGFFVIENQHVAAGHQVDANLIDLFPTILYMMDLEIPNNIDGCLMEECFSPEWIKLHPPRYATNGESVLVKVGTSGYTPEEEASMLEQLRQLGYVD